MINKKEELAVFISLRESTCDECGENLGKKAWIFLNKNKKALCLPCAELDYLVFLPSGNAALTRRAKKFSTLSAVVLKWSRTRKQYERQGLLVEEQALEAAETECLNDQEIRERKKQYAAEKRAELDQEYVRNFAAQIRKLYPHCPQNREFTIAEHACRKYSERIGRTTAAKNFNEEAIRLAVIAHIRHRETEYTNLLAHGYDRSEARGAVADKVQDVLSAWESSPQSGDIK